MRNSLTLIAALAYIEANITEPLKIGDVAKACYCSVSGLQRIFSAVFGYSLKEYAMKRRLSQAARELSEGSTSVTEVALKYQYGSPEAFARAFQRIFNEAPSLYRRQYRIREFFPPLTVENSDKGGEVLKKVDLSGLYDFVKESAGSYMVCADLVAMAEINNQYGLAAGDAVLAEAAKRIARYTTDEMIVLRVGNDEFLALTGLHDRGAVEELAQAVLAHNGETVRSNEIDVPFSLRVAIAQVPSGSNILPDLLQVFFEAVDGVRKE